MRSFLTGIIFSFILLICFTLFRNGIGLWNAFILSLIFSVLGFAYYIKRKKPTIREIVLISLGTGVFYMIFASVGIKLFPVEKIRDIGDLAMPYVNALSFGLFTVFAFIFFGITFQRYLK